MIDSVELVCKRQHMPYPNVRIPAGTRVSIGPPWIAEALCVRGFFEKVPDDILKAEREAEYAERKNVEDAQIAAQKEAEAETKPEAEAKAEKAAEKKTGKAEK